MIRNSLYYKTYLLIKRIIDIIISSIILFFTSPILIFLFAYVKKYNNGRALFRQIRIKKNRRQYQNLTYYWNNETEKFELSKRRYDCPYYSDKLERRYTSEDLFYYCPYRKSFKPNRRKVNYGGEFFKFYKLRTMFSNARKRYPDLYKYKYKKDEITKIRFKKEEDPRVVPRLAWLRSSTLDELPNFINVLKGDMTLVGPRPDIPDMIKYYTPAQRRKLSVKPGVTGFAQIYGRGHLSFQKTLYYDLEYVKKQSLFIDIKVLFKTFILLFVEKEKNGAF